MKIYVTLTLSLTVVSLLGCQTLVTQNSGKATHAPMVATHTRPEADAKGETQPDVEDFGAQTIELPPKGENKAATEEIDTLVEDASSGIESKANLAFTSYRIDEVTTDFASEARPGGLFSMAWTTLADDSLPKEPPISGSQSSTTPPIEKNRWVNNRQTPHAPSQAQSLATKPFASQSQMGEVSVKHTNKRGGDFGQSTAEKFADKTHNEATEPLTVTESAERTLEVSPHNSHDLWHRIRNGYGLPDIAHPKTQRFVREYVNNPSYFKRISKNAAPYLYHIVAEIEKRGMPLEIALLPAIESGYQPMALSPKSASGLWQFIPATGRLYGLKRTRWYDGRRDIIASTAAALNYLQTLHKMFDNDWLLALAAYNYGHGSIEKAIRKNLKQGKPTDFWSLKLPRETRKYVPKLLALSMIVANPQGYGIELQPIANQPYFTRVKVERQIDWYNAARLAGLSVTEFKRLNACYRRGVTAPKGPHNVILPIHKVHQFEQRLAEIPAKVKLVQARKVPTRQKHRVRKGDNLWDIAKRYGTTVTALRRLNDLNGGGHTLSIGQRLIVQKKAPKASPNSRYKKKRSKKTTHIHRIKTRKHRVRKGDNLWTIAKRYSTTVSLLRKLNNFKGRILKIGSFLKVPTVATLSN